jgi:hypothetical protein
MAKEIAVGQTEREGIRGTVRETLDNEVSRVYGIAAKCLLQRLVKESQVRPIATQENIPRP